MATSVNSDCKKRNTQALDEKAAWFTPRIGRLEIQRTMATSGTGEDFGFVSG